MPPTNRVSLARARARARVRARVRARARARRRELLELGFIRRFLQFFAGGAVVKQ